MNAWRRTLRRLRLLVHRREVERKLDDEMRCHLEMEIEDLIQRGVPRRQAERQARIAFGSLESTKEAVRDSRGTRAIEDFLQDLRYALRSFLKTPGFTAAALLTLALGIGATTAIFSVLDAVVLRPMPYPDSDRVFLFDVSLGGRNGRQLSPAEFFDYSERLEIAQIGAWAHDALNLTGGGEPEQVRTAFVTSGVLPALGLSPVIGRGFTEEETRQGDHLVILDHGFWMRRFGGDPDVIGTEITLQDTAAVVIGVAPEGARLPDDILSGQSVSLFVPLGIPPEAITNRGSHFLNGVGRFDRGVDREVGREAVAALSRWMVEEFPNDYTPEDQFGIEAVPIDEAIVGGIRPAILVLLGGVSVVLAIVCVNLLNLLLCRADERREEIALRTALGADRFRLVRQMITESLLLALAGGGLGVLLATFGTRALVALEPANVPRIAEAGVDARVLSFALAVSILTGLAFGLLPALRLSRFGLTASMPGRTTAMPGGRWSRHGVVVAEVALAFVLLAAAALVGRSFLNLYSVDTGFRAEHVLAVNVSPSSTRYSESTKLTSFYEELIARLAEQPGVVSASAVLNLPLATRQGDMSFEHEGSPVPEGRSKPDADWQVVTPDYFATLQLPVIRGRSLSPTDRSQAPGAIAINQEMARLFWPDSDPLGKRIRLGGENTEPRWATVVGIVGNVTHNGLDAAPRPQMYFTHQQFRHWTSGRPASAMTLVVRTDHDPAAVATTIEREVHAIDPQIPLGTFRRLEQVVDSSLSQPRLVVILLGLFSTLALALAAIGVYGILAHLVGRRRQEISVRMALGADRWSVAAMVLRQGISLVAIGLVVGMGVARAVTPAISGILFQVDPGDPFSLFATAGVLLLVAVAACLLPVRLATRIDPSAALRVE